MADRTTFPSQYEGSSVATLDAALTAASAAAYSAERLSQMTLNDKIYAAKQLAKNTTLPAPDGSTAWVNPWEQTGA